MQYTTNDNIEDDTVKDWSLIKIKTVEKDHDNTVADDEYIVSYWDEDEWNKIQVNNNKDVMWSEFHNHNCKGLEIIHEWKC